MYCDEALEAVDYVASGELALDGRLAEHYESCPNCAAALDRARALERLLQTREAPRAPAQFTARTMTRVRRVRWRAEQFLDVGFNIAMVVLVLSIVGGAWMVLDKSGLAAVSNDAMNLMSGAIVTFAQRAAPSLPLYLGATALLLTALGIWWWAEREGGDIRM